MILHRLINTTVVSYSDLTQKCHDLLLRSLCVARPLINHVRYPNCNQMFLVFSFSPVYLVRIQVFFPRSVIDIYTMSLYLATNPVFWTSVCPILLPRSLFAHKHLVSQQIYISQNIGSTIYSFFLVFSYDIIYCHFQVLLKLFFTF